MAVTHIVQDLFHTDMQTFVEFAGNFDKWHHGLSSFDLPKYKQTTSITHVFYQIIPIKNLNDMR
jgi:hypothetical protein